MATLSLSILEIIVLMMGAVVLGITIHFFITSRRSFGTTPTDSVKLTKSLEEWKLKYFNDIEIRDKELNIIRKQFDEVQESNSINTIEAEEMRRENKRLQTEIASIRKTMPAGEKPDYLGQLRETQSSLLEHNEKITQLLGQIEIVKETEEKQKELQEENEVLMEQVAELKAILAQKEMEINNVRQKEHLTKEMNSMLDSAYSEFNLLQGKLQKLESEVNSSKLLNLEYEDLKEAYYKMNKDLEEQRGRAAAAVSDSQRMQSHLIETEDKLREANFQRQQLQKRVAYLEELNRELQTVSDANKKLEGQLRRIGELESMLNVVSEERDELARRHG
jgi:chromosome segregation ATPase